MHTGLSRREDCYRSWPCGLGIALASSPGSCAHSGDVQEPSVVQVQLVSTRVILTLASFYIFPSFPIPVLSPTTPFFERETYF